MNKASHFSVSPYLQGLIPAFFCLLSGLPDRLYTDIDSFLVSIACAGLYGNLSVCPVIHPLLGVCLNFLSRIFTSVDWFTFFSRIFTVVAIWWLGVLIAYFVSPRIKRLSLLVAVSLLVFTFTIFNTNYTVHSGLFAFIGITTFFLLLRAPTPRGSAFVAAFYLCLSILWRPEGAALFIPFLALDLIVMLFRHKMPEHCLRRFLLPCLGLVCLLTVAFFVASLFPGMYTGDTPYSDARRSIMDYPVYPWEDVKETAEEFGITENDYYALSDSVLCDTDFTTAARMRTVSSFGRAATYPLALSSLRPMLVDFVHRLSTPLHITLALLTGVLLGSILLSASSLLCKLEALCAIGGSIIIALFYMYIGRFPDRLLICVFLTELSVLLPLFFEAPPCAIRFPFKLLWGSAGVVVALLLCISVWDNRYNYHITQMSINARVNVPEDGLVTGFEDDAIYIWKPMTMALYMTEHYMQEGKLPPTDFLLQNLGWGEWTTSGQPFYDKILSELNLENPMEGLLTRPHTYLISEDSSLIETWLREHYDPSATLQQVGTVDVFALGPVPIWQAVTN